MDSLQNLINRRLVAFFILATFILCVPLIAMQFTSEVNWKPGDFLVAGILLFGTGILAEVALRQIKRPAIRIVGLVILILSLLLLWAELAVGIFGTPLAGS